MRTENKKVIIHAENCAGCLSCQLICSLTYQKVFNPAKAFLQVQYLGRAGKNNLVYFSDECNECGLCAEYCHFNALTLREKQEVASPATG